MGKRHWFDRLVIGFTAAMVAAMLGMASWLSYAEVRADRACRAAGYTHSEGAHFNGDAECVVAPVRTVRLRASKGGAR